MGDEKQVLDHGYIRLIESWGSDERIVEAARMSTGKGFLGWGVEGVCERCSGTGKCGPWGDSNRDVDNVQRCNACGGTGKAVAVPGDEKLLRYLWENKHATPFEMAGLVIEVQAPIFVFREWHRHRTQSYNEMSSRYMPLPDVNYVPSVERLLMGGGHLTKQAGTVKGSEELTEGKAEVVRHALTLLYGDQQRAYDEFLKWGVPKELARIHLPVGRYSRMRASQIG